MNQGGRGRKEGRERQGEGKQNGGARGRRKGERREAGYIRRIYKNKRSKVLGLRMGREAQTERRERGAGRRGRRGAGREGGMRLPVDLVEVLRQRQRW